MSIPKLGRPIWQGKDEQARRAAADISLPGIVPSISVDVKEPIEADISGITPQQAVDVLLPFLPEYVQGRIREAAVQLQLPVWQMVLGYVMRIADFNELFTPYVLMASWDRNQKADEPRPCRSCGVLFSSVWPNAAYCCDRCACGKLEEFGHREECTTREFTNSVRSRVVI